MLKFFSRKIVLAPIALLAARLAVGLSVDEVQSYSLLAKPRSESLSAVNNYQPSHALLSNGGVNAALNTQQEMPITKDDQFIMQNGKIELINDTEMQVRPNGINLKVQY